MAYLSQGLRQIIEKEDYLGTSPTYNMDAEVMILKARASKTDGVYDILPRSLDPSTFLLPRTGG